MPKPIRRGANSWQVKLRRKLPDGSTSNINRTFDSFVEAQTFIESTLGRVAGHERMDRRRERETSFRMLLERYRTDIVSKKPRKPAAQQTSVLNKWARVEWADWPILTLEASLFATWRNEQVARGASGSTVSNAMNTLSGVFRTAISEWGLRITNPLAGLSRPKPAPAREAYLDADEETRLLEACRLGPPQLVWAVKIALTTAMRAAEIRGLKWSHANLKTRIVHLPQTKNGEKRDVPLILPGAVEAFVAIRKSLPVRDDDYIFGDPEKPGSAGGYSATMLTHAFSDAAERAGMPDFRFHDLRHVATTRLAPLHRDALDLSKTTGHKTLAVLARYYNERPEDRVARLTAASRSAVKQIKGSRARKSSNND